jgi:hypothetical protein
VKVIVPRLRREWERLTFRYGTHQYLVLAHMSSSRTGLLNDMLVVKLAKPPYLQDPLDPIIQSNIQTIHQIACLSPKLAGYGIRVRLPIKRPVWSPLGVFHWVVRRYGTALNNK